MPLHARPKRRQHHMQQRWESWQATQPVQRYLPLEAQQQGYTVVKVPPQCREAFLEFVALTFAYARLTNRRETPETVRPLWQRWGTWMRQIRHYYAALLDGKEGQIPGGPHA